MITELQLEQFLFMPDTHLEFTPGLNVITGETGAGKSILLEAVKLILGKKARSGLVLPGRTSARLQARFEIGGKSLLLAKLAEMGLTNEDDPATLLISRTFKAEGSDKVLINGIMTTATALRELGSYLMEIHGQNEHQTLLMPDIQRHLLDRMGGEAHQKRLDKLAQAFSEHRRLTRELDELETRLASGAERLETLTAALGELDALRLTDPEEEARLKEECHRLAHGEQLAETIAEALQSLDGDDESTGAVRLLHRALDAAQNAGTIDPGLTSFAGRLEALYYEAADISSALRREADVEFDPDRLSLVQSRLSAFQQACRRHRTDFAGLFPLIEGIRKEIGDLTAPDSSRARLRKALDEAERSLSTAAGDVSTARRTIAAKLEKQVSTIMEELGFHAARFSIGMKPVPVTTAGQEAIEFLVALNPGAPGGPLRKIASGGELSRVALALKQVLAEGDDLPTLLFDEIDAGIGGTTAEAVATSLERLSRKKQVVLVTHLHQIAKEADRHFTVTKRVIDGATEVRIGEVKKAEREAEIARMLGRTGSEGLAFARALLRRERPSRAVAGSN
ncbi:MAG TPA: DNA repair protein RecN [Candidatus Ozemobacteraceae bacterium]|nr:DNA repair protein RecN [Candidatus Ozemobacteraceae bacterium]